MFDKLDDAGEHPFLIEGLVGDIEGVLTVPPETNPHFIALLGHPHSLQGGSMNNKVVTTMARAFKEAGIASLRFNFRGVGASAGKYDAGIGESEDMLHLANVWQQARPESRMLFAGFSFGSYVAYRAAAQSVSQLLITVAPPVHHYRYDAYVQPQHWHILQGDDDDVVPASLVLDFAAKASPPIPVIQFAQTGHFFHGKLVPLKETLIEIIKSRLKNDDLK